MLKKIIYSLVLLVLVGCSNQTANSNNNDPASLQLAWSMPNTPSLFYTALYGDLLFGRKKLTAVNIRTHKVAFERPEPIDYGRSTVAPLGENFVAVTGELSDTVTVINKNGELLNSFRLPGRPGAALGNMGPVVKGSSLYLASAATVYKYRVSDLLSPEATPTWTRTFAGYNLGAFAVLDEDHIFVTTNADTEYRLYALDAAGQDRWKVDNAPAGKVLGGSYALDFYKDIIIAPSGSAGLQAYKIDTGEKAWPNFPDMSICPDAIGKIELIGNFIVADNKIILSPFSGTCVMAFSAETGEASWYSVPPNKLSFDTKPVYHNGVLYVTNGKLWAIDVESGKILASSQEELGANRGSPLSYDPQTNQIIEWSSAGVHAFQALR